MDYLLKASGIVVLLFLFYFVLLRNETFFKSIRSYFLFGLIIVVAIPLIEIPIYIEAVAKDLSQFDFQNVTVSEAVLGESINWLQLFTYIYLAGVLFFTVKFLIQLCSLGIWLSRHKLIKQGDFYYVETSKSVSPFSFFNIIIFNKSQYSIDELEQIINHEKAHVLQWHSIDTLLAHMLVITLWFNPFVWLYKKAVQQNLEFLADAYAINQSANQKQYQLTLLKTCGAPFCTQLTNNFYNSLIKKRIIMIHKNKSQSNNQWKYAFLVPLLAAFVFTFNTKVVAQEKEKELVEVHESSMIVLLIDKNSTDESLKKEAQTFKDEFDIALTFKGVKRNSDKEITAIKIDAKGNDISANYSTSSDKPISPIKISYSSGDNSISIGNAGNLHKNKFVYSISEGHGKNAHVKKKGNYVFVTKDGKKSTWTEKGDKELKYEVIIVEEKDGKGENIELKVIGDKGDKKNVWIHEKDKHGKVKAEVIQIKEGAQMIKIVEGKNIHRDKDHNIEVIEEKDGEKIITIHKTGDKMKNKIIKGDNFLFIGEGDDKPLIFIDGEEATEKEMKELGPDGIEKVEVLKGEKATEKYGKKAKDGVILITTKKE